MKLGHTTPDEVMATLRVAHPGRARTMLEMWGAGLAAVEPEKAVAGALEDGLFTGAVTVVALGKAAPAMARGAAMALGKPPNLGVVVSDHPEPVPPGMELILGGHPDPDQSSLTAGRRILEVVRRARGELLFLVSGGGSALAEVPAGGLTVEDLAATRKALQERGVAITEMNTVRTHLSRLKGGRVAAAATVPVTTVVISDVPGPGPHLVASGPTLPTSTTPGDARAVLEQYRVSVPAAVMRALAEASPPPPIPPGRLIVAADCQKAARAAAEAAGARVITTTLSGRAADAARRALAATPPGTIGVLAGETTVEVTGSGTGGRNQEAALAAALAGRDSGILFMAAGTDGIDGPTDAAGGLVDGATADRISAAGLNATACLSENDSYRALDAARALIRTGPTGTNVADLWIVDHS